MRCFGSVFHKNKEIVLAIGVFTGTGTTVQGQGLKRVSVKPGHKDGLSAKRFQENSHA
jgi:hypothetical protein